MNPPGPEVPPRPAALTIGVFNTDASSSVWSYSVSGARPLPPSRRIGRSLNGDDVIGGSLPSALAVSPDGKRLAVTSSNNDLVQVLDLTKTDANGHHSASTIDLKVIAGGPTGSQPDAVAWTADGHRLLVGEGGRNAVAVVDATHLSPDITPTPLHEPDGTANRAAVLGATDGLVPHRRRTVDRRVDALGRQQHGPRLRPERSPCRTGPRRRHRPTTPPSPTRSSAACSRWIWGGPSTTSRR